MERRANHRTGTLLTRRLFFQLHWFLGITAGLVLAVMGVTGGLLSFEDEISEAFSPRLFAPGVPSSPDLSPDRVIAKLEAEHQGYVITRLDWDMARDRSHAVRLERGKGRERLNGRVDRATGAWLGEPATAGFFKTIEDLHRWLALPGGSDGIGRQITGLSALALIFFAFSGLYLRWPRRAFYWRSWLVLDWRKTGRNLWRALHATVGTWVLLFYLLSALTGLWWSYDWYRSGVTYALTGKSTVNEDNTGKPGEQGSGRPAIDQAWTAFLHGPGAQYDWVRISLPRPGEQAKKLNFDARRADARHLRQTDRYSYDPVTAALVKSDLYVKRPLGKIVTQSMFEIHRGAFFGLPGRIMLLLTSLAMPLFTVTGWLLYLSRRSRKRALAAVSGSAPLAMEGDGQFLVVHASQTGTAERHAREAAQALAEGGIVAKIMPLSALTREILEHADAALFVTSTYGEGEPPDVARGFARRMMADPLPLSHLSHGVLALGDHEYPDFCAFGLRLDSWLSASGSRALFPTITMDREDAQAEQRWHVELAGLGAGDVTPLAHLPDLAQWTLAERILLNPGSGHLGAYHLRLVPRDGEFPAWEAGDIVEIEPGNDPVEIERIIRSLPAGADILTDEAELRTHLSRAILPSTDVPITRKLIDGLHPIALREYSAASVPSDGSLDLVVRQVRYPDGRFGLGSGWLTAHRTVGDTIMLRLRANPGFRAGTNARRLILIGNGTGIAGLRAHLRARAASSDKGHWLLFGERQRAHEAFFEAELQGWLADGTLAQLDRAFSRDPECGRYVQDLLLIHRDAIRLWIEDGASVLVCGSLDGMAAGVHAALADILGSDHLESMIEMGLYKRDVY